MSAILLAAIGYIQTLNAFGRNLKVHGLNLSLGYPFRPEWFAAGQSPLCVEVDRLVKSGVVVVAARCRKPLRNDAFKAHLGHLI
jgi:serine protease AprX